MQVKDIMTREVITVTEDMPIVTVAEILHKHSIHAAPVVDEKGGMVGIITETDFFVKDAAAVYLPAYAQILHQKLDQHIKKNSGHDATVLETLASAVARDIMTPNPTTIPDVADIRDIITLIRMHHFKTFPVTNFSGELVGVVSIIDIIATIGKQMKLEENT